ncbi:hypothetical protein GDO86_011304 [Hymenochirus boettgeri]|uniref:Uncharacterized protein n=1 Tax=Hymenochirus boettgeri TaxID=247094 RepID=A0A8T2JIL8_9PIPI|nr:hypothetical protein GDO86_011304 [Hymenochirus boettgeri]
MRRITNTWVNPIFWQTLMNFCCCGKAIYMHLPQKQGIFGQVSICFILWITVCHINANAREHTRSLLESLRNSHGLSWSSLVLSSAILVFYTTEIFNKLYTTFALIKGPKPCWE